MKQEAAKTSKKWLWLVAGLAVVLAVAGVVLGFVLNPGQQDQAADTAQGKLYWNVDRVAYVDPEIGLSTREPGEDGLYHVRFATGGQLVELAVAGDKQLINYMDSMGVVSLVLDADGIVTDVVDPKTVATEVAREVYVKELNGNTLVMNSSMAMNGMEITAELLETTGVYDVSPTADPVGKVVQCAPMDQVTVYADQEGNVTDVFVLEHAIEAEVYWRLDKFYSGGMTTREPDENGVYTINFAYKGEHVQCKSKDKEIVSSIDSITTANAMFGLVFDEEGYIIDWVSASLALHGIELCNNYNVTALDGNTFTATRFMTGSKAGDVVTATIDESCEMYLVCHGGTVESHIGEKITQLQPDDLITCITDLDGKPVLIYVIRRQVDSPMYYNLSRKYNSSNKETTRKVDASGYYVFELASQGGTVTVRTKDKTIASQMDSYSNQGMGLKLNGSIVEKVYDPGCVCGWTAGGVGRYVTALSGSIVSLTLFEGEANVANALIRQDCEIYDVTGNYGIKLGGVTELRMFDRITCFKNTAGELTHIFITDRYVEGTTLYYNSSRRYNGNLKETTRKPDEEGYYVYEMHSGGKAVTVKTKSKAMADFIDSQTAPIVALKVSGGIVREAYTAVTAVKFGYKVANYHYFSHMDDGKIVTSYSSNGVKKEGTLKPALTDKTAVYNVSDGYLDHKGERSTLKKDDQIQIISSRETGEAVYVFIMDRQVDSPLYWHVNRKYNTNLKETTRTPDAEGYYVFELAVNGQVKQFKTKDKDLASRIDAQTGAFGLLLNGDIIRQIYTAAAVEGVKSLKVGRYDVMAIDGSKITFTRNRATSSDYGTTMELKLASGCKIYDVSAYAENFGAEAKLELGDRVAGYVNDDGELVYCYITNKNTRTAGHVSLCEHCDKEVFWEPYAGEILKAEGVHYYLPCDSERSSQITIGSEEEAYDVVFDLNGKTLTSKGRGFLTYAQLSIMDSAGGGKVVASNGAGGNGGCIMATKGGGLDLYGGTLTVAQESTTSNAGVVYIASGGVFNMYGGTVTGGKVTSQEKMPFGGNISILTATFNMYGGTVSGGIAEGTGRGGNIYLSKSTFNMYGGTVSGGTADRAGNIYAAGKSTVNISGGEVLGGTAQDRGGSILADGVGGSINISGGKVSGGTAKGTFGGNICLVNTVELNISGGTVEKGTAAGNGGNLAISGVGATINITGGTVIGGTAQGGYGGGNIYITGKNAETVAKLNISGGTVSYGTGKSGGNIRINSNAEAVITGGSILGGTADQGSSIGMGSVTSRLAISGGSITGGDVYINKDGTTTVSGAPVIGSFVVEPGITVKLGELTQGAKITVDAQGAFTVANQNAESYKAYFTPKDAADTVYVKNNVLYCGDPNADTGGELALDENGMAMCPVCQESVTWAKLNSTTGAYNNTDGSTKHYYLPGDLVNTATNMNFMSVMNNSSTCLHLNGYDLSFVNRIFVISGGALNIMGSGSVTGGYADGTICTSGESYINLLGGTYVNTTADAPALGLTSIYANLTIHEDASVAGVKVSAGSMTAAGSITGTANITGGSLKLSGQANAEKITVGTGGKLIVAADWTGTAVAGFEGITQWIPETNGVSEGDFTGKLYLDAEGSPAITAKDGRLVIAGAPEEDPGEDPGEDPNVDPFTANLVFAEGTSDAYCPACQETVTWTKVNSKTGAYNNTDGSTKHYYLPDDLANTATNLNFMSVMNGGKSCLHLNGNDLSFANRIFVGSGGSTFNIMGTGTVTGGYADGMIYSNGESNINIYSGTYANTAADAPALGLMSVKANMTLYATAANVKVTSGTLKLTGEAQADKITVGTNGKLIVAADWTGTATVAFEGVTDEIPATMGVSEGDFTGLLYLDTAEKPAITAKDGGLIIGTATQDPNYDPFTADLVFDEGTSDAYCPACQETVTWTKVNSKTGAYNNTDGSTKHYYLPEDLVNTATNLNFMSVMNNGKTCLHLNGKSLSIVNRIYATSGGTLNIMGTGTVTGGYADGVIYSNGKSSVNVYTGTYVNTTQDAPALGLLSIYASANLYTAVPEAKVASGTLKLTGEAQADKIAVGANGKLIVAADWTGTATVAFEGVTDEIPATMGVSEGDFTGKLYLDTAEKPEITAKDGGLVIAVAENPYTKNLEFQDDGTTAYCPACQKDVQWTALSGNNRMGYHSGKSDLHYYLSGEVATGTTWNQFTELANSTACLHLNGNNLTCGGRINASGGSTLNIMGSGTVTCDGAYTGNKVDTYVVATVQVMGKATINLYGGTYKCTKEGLPVALVQSNDEAALNVYEGAVIEGSATSKGALVKLGSLNILGGTLHGGINTHSGTVTLGGNATVTGTEGELTGNIYVSTTSKLVVNADFAGLASAAFGSTILDGVIPEANGASMGAYTGVLHLETEGNPRIVADDGKLKVEQVSQ